MNPTLLPAEANAILWSLTIADSQPSVQALQEETEVNWPQSRDWQGESRNEGGGARAAARNCPSPRSLVPSNRLADLDRHPLLWP